MQAHFDAVVHRESREHAPVSPAILGNLGAFGHILDRFLGSSIAVSEFTLACPKTFHVQSGIKVGHETRPPRQVARLLVLRNVLQPIYMRNHVHAAMYPSLSLSPPFGY